MTTGDVLEALLRLKVDLVIVSGGEPLSQQRPLVPLLRLLNQHGIAVDIETNGTRGLLPGFAGMVRRFVVSPKLSHSGDPASRRIVPGALTSLLSSGKADFKFVVRSVADLDEVDRIVRDNGLHRIWIMPEGRRADDVLRTLREIADDVVRRGWNLTTRLHVLAWGDMRAV